MKPLSVIAVLAHQSASLELQFTSSSSGSQAAAPEHIHVIAVVTVAKKTA